jgi:uncharacterized protein (DUF2267 family)
MLEGEVGQSRRGTKLLKYIEDRLRGNAAQFIAAEGPERIIIRELYGDGWDQLEDPAQIGREFRALVESGQIEGLRSLPRREWNNQRNHVEYVRNR